MKHLKTAFSMQRWPSLPKTAAIAILLCSGQICPSLSLSYGDDGEHHWALLIGVEKYQLAPPLQYTVNDVAQLADTLANRGGYQVRRMVETAADPERQPLRKSILAMLPDWLGDLTPEDSALVYFSGHGFRDPDGKLYLAPIDCDPKRPAETGIPVDWLRDQIGRCRARFKLLVIDACHAGCEKGEETARSISAKDLGSSFEQLSGVVTLASSLSNEQSLVWDEKQQSLFSYWLNQGLQGNADRDCDGAVTIDELYRYVYQNVPYVAEKHFSRRQTPARIVGPRTPGVEEIIRPRPRSLKAALDDMAENLATTLQLRQLSAVGVPEFVVDARETELELGVHFGILGRYCATELEGRLAEKSADKFDVLQDDMLQKTLHAKGIGVKELRTSATKGLSADNHPIPAFALGILRIRKGREIVLQCELRGTDRQNILTTAGETALLNESEWAMLGRSAEVADDDRVVEAPRPGHASPSPAATLIARLDEKARQPHPLADPGFPFRVRILVGGFERPGTAHGNDWIVPLHKGEVYEIRATSHIDQPVFLRLLVDGLNTLPEKARGLSRKKARGLSRKKARGLSRFSSDENGTVPLGQSDGNGTVPLGAKKSITVEATAGKPRPYLPAQRVNLAEARAWQLDPNTEFGIPGFFSQTGEHAQYREFKVVDAPRSEAARQQFTDQLGLITAAFYSAKPKTTSRSMVGTGMGNEYHVQTGEYEDTVPGDLLAVVHIRYVEPDTTAESQ